MNTGIGENPNDVFYGKLKLDVEIPEPIDRLEIGQKVRVKEINKKNIFDKKYNNLWSDEKYIIKEYEGNGYLLNGKNR